MRWWTRTGGNAPTGQAAAGTAAGPGQLGAASSSGAGKCKEHGCHRLSAEPTLAREAWRQLCNEGRPSSPARSCEAGPSTSSMQLDSGLEPS
eukprot:3726717-Pleurochrysis_carterae.AAC.1